ncbi:MAG: hypothetical protein FJX74_18595 [Armatimonadetes bacterium]|nr:hypothetical protein [Armatimonadota bacterium]
MPVAARTAHGMMEEKARKSVADLIDRVRRATIEKAHQVQLPGYAREAVSRIDRKFFQSRLLVVAGPPRFHPEMQVFLPTLLLSDACDHRRLRDKLDDYAKYLVANYPWAWCTSPVTLPMRLQAKDLLLREGESEFGDTPLAAAMAFVRYHYEMVKLTTLTDFGALYNRAFSLEREGHFKNQDAEATALWEGLKEHPEDEMTSLSEEAAREAAAGEGVRE